MISVLIDPGFLTGIKESRAEFVEDIDAGFEAAGDAVAEKLRSDVSGRKPDDTGLNIRTGTLFNSIETFAQRSPDGMTSAVFNQGADYWRYHEQGAGANPKRLFWGDYWNQSAPKLYETAVNEALGRAAA